MIVTEKNCYSQFPEERPYMTAWGSTKVSQEIGVKGKARQKLSCGFCR